ncbi:hypothetical protein GCM10011408_12340 [Dyella caseinilytica]|nr:hypothetical protein GCM10011408_12340 [Dyella caseinilytica]
MSRNMPRITVRRPGPGRDPETYAPPKTPDPGLRRDDDSLAISMTSEHASRPAKSPQVLDPSNPLLAANPPP